MDTRLVITTIMCRNSYSWGTDMRVSSDWGTLQIAQQEIDLAQMSAAGLYKAEDQLFAEDASELMEPL